MAQLGYEKLDDVIGRTDLLQPRDISLVKTQHIDLSYILSVCVVYFLNRLLLLENALFFFFFGHRLSWSNKCPTSLAYV